MENKTDLDEIYESIADDLAMARTHHSQGRIADANLRCYSAYMDFVKYEGCLSEYPGYHALKHAFEVTLSVIYPKRLNPNGVTQEDSLDTVI